MWLAVYLILALLKNLPEQMTVLPFQAKAVLIEHGSRAVKKVALTFDACMTPRMKDELDKGIVSGWYNKEVVDILRKEKVPATFFISGLWAKSYPEIVKNLFGERFTNTLWTAWVPTSWQSKQFEIENHSWDHAAMKTPCFGLAESMDKVAEVNLTQQILTDLTGRAPHYFRFPGGCYADSDLKLLSDHGVQGLDWDVISGDAFLKDPVKIEHEVLSNVKNGSIVIMHVVGGRTAPATAEALPAIIKGLRQKGYELVTVQDLLKSK